MVVREDHDVIQVPVHIIIGQTFVNLGHTATPSGFAHQPIHNGTLQWEVHDARQIGGVIVHLGRSRLPIADQRWIADPFLPDNVEVRVFVEYSLGPIRQELLVRIRPGIHSNAVQS